MTEMNEGASNIKELLNFPENVEPSINKHPLYLKKYMTYKAAIALDTNPKRKEVFSTYIQSAESGDITSTTPTTTPQPKSVKQICPVTDSFTDFNYNFKL